MSFSPHSHAIQSPTQAHATHKREGKENEKEKKRKENENPTRLKETSTIQLEKEWNCQECIQVMNSSL